MEPPWRDNRRRLLASAEDQGLDGLVLLSPSNITYATGLRGPSGAVLLSNKCPHIVLVPLLDYQRVLDAIDEDFDVIAVYRGSDETVESYIPDKKLIRATLTDAILKFINDCGGKWGADLSSLSYTVASKLSSKGIEDASNIISKVRSVKSAAEIEAIRRASAVAEEAFSRLINDLEPGISEAQAAARLYEYMISGGAWGEAFNTIVAFYANTAYPHHAPQGGARLGRPGPVLVDWGAVVSGYRSDTTRTFWWGGAKASDSFVKHLEVVEDALNRALDILAPGVKAWEVDNAARTTLRKAGLSKYFIHGLGHGVGVDIHEAPYLRPGSQDELEPGMIVTIEPGIYLPGLYGIRIEDLVEITPSGFRVITRLPHILPY